MRPESFLRRLALVALLLMILPTASGLAVCIRDHDHEPPAAKADERWPFVVIIHAFSPAASSALADGRLDAKLRPRPAGALVHLREAQRIFQLSPRAGRRRLRDRLPCCSLMTRR